MDTTLKQLTEDAKAILLLCGRFGKSDRDDPIKPLSLTEYNRLTDWMKTRNTRPAELLASVADDMALDAGKSIEPERIRRLLSRGTAMAFAVERWASNGIWILCRSDDSYPKKIKDHLKKNQSPPILYGVGNRDLLSQGGLAVVGSRNVDAAGESFTQRVAETCARDGMPVVSGGARGVDQIAMLSALNAGGSATGVLADGLFKTSVARKYREGLRESRLVLVSPYHPESRFTVGNAMGRNKLVYALADVGLVVSAEKDKGGTWAGAKEELRREKAKPVFVWTEVEAPKGNRALIDLGAQSFPESPWRENLKQLLKQELIPQRWMPTQRPLFGEHEPQPVASGSIKEAQPVFETPSANIEDAEAGEMQIDEKPPQTAYDAILPLLLKWTQDWKTPQELIAALKIRKRQFDDWIKRAVAEDKIERKIRPVRYRRK